jgi:hypothetical protein
MDMGLLSNPAVSGLLKPPKSQNQQYQYSAKMNFNRNQMANSTFTPMTTYFGSGFKQIGANDPLYNSKQIFYNQTNNDQVSQGGIFGKQNQLRESLRNNTGFGFKLNNEGYPNLNQENTINIHQKTQNSFDNINLPSKFRGSFSQNTDKLPDTPVFKQTNKRASNLRKILEKRDHEEMTSNKKETKEIKKEMLDPRTSTKKKSK